jgi:7,8-dihydropterin-6-yl-methyl-4-(beta-D-ribofuranosyl)aminobenzene 5'-phosphate synthase
LTCEHGLSLYIETDDTRILFDAGQSDAFADNAIKLGIDLRRVDFAVLSHGHYDHGGGLLRFLDINDTAPIYLSRKAFAPCCNAKRKYIGLDPALRDQDRLRYVDGILELGPGITLHGAWNLPLRHPLESYGLCVKNQDGYITDDFCHEQYLCIREKERTVCFSGCSHKGIQNIVHQFQPDVLVGGFHFMKLDPTGPDAMRLDAAAKDLLGYETVYYTGHCTGELQFAYLKERMGRRLNALSVGTDFVL